MAGLPLIKTGNPAMDLFMTRAKSQLDPLLSNKITQGTLVQNITLNPGVNYINHKLGETPVGWILVDITGQADVWRTAPFTDTVLTLTSSAATSMTISLWVF